MGIDTTNTILARIYTRNANILGMLKNLEAIMDDNSYQELYEGYLVLEKDVPKDEGLTEYEKKYGDFGTDLEYLDVERALEDFEGKLSYYNGYKELSDAIKKVRSATREAFTQNFSIDDYIQDNIDLVDLLLHIKDDKAIRQFTKLTDTSIKTIFNSLKTLSIAGNNQLLDYIGQTYSSYLREHLAVEVRNSIDVTSFSGNLEDDYVNADTLYECAVQDKTIMTRCEEAKEFAERERLAKLEREQRVSRLYDHLKVLDSNIETYKEQLNKLNLSIHSIQAKRLFLRLIAVPAIAIPLTCPFIGRILGQKASSKVLLTKTITDTIDMDTGRSIYHDESDEELNTAYVASVTICDPWKKNLSGASYSRNCTVYDYVLSEDEEREEDFHLTRDNMDPSNLVKKYTYQESSPSVSDPKYLTDSQIYVTETYQDLSKMTPSTKYNIPYTIAGVGVGVLFGTTEALAYSFFGKRLLEDADDNFKKNLLDSEVRAQETEKVLKLAMIKKQQTLADYHSLTK